MEPFWRMTYTKGKKPQPIRIAINDLSNQRMSEMKVRFGPSYGIPAEFIALLLRGDMDAIACAIWIGQQKEGYEVEDPREMDFNLEDLEPLEDPKQEDEGEKAERPTKRRTPASAKTSESSETPTSSTSETSSG